ncbi:uncharacterized protein PV07_05233 [Cladophialophora immunda]|uniref:Uncharacterized protein n=1 Tax=Cladophialophora immunda TaxID=569365 RepID=A0A0D2AVX2_9EURO|nr:uncharacterized protein PV07_05233 [Cladophialophora immunda]KIW29417.1 hypothetical protein PV07_05233 [Cladophialophora immunda]OQV09335.1 hypothetical protein CLAIMM_13467 [Cladophialophora immunda]
MSQGMTKRPPEFTDLPRGKQFPSHILAQLDERFKHLSDTILPPQPYLLSVPSDVPYRHSSRFVNTWYEGTPFDRKEEQLQYLSFLPHSGEHEALLKVEGGWADDHGNPIVEEELSPKALPASGRHTPADTGNRKKISLKDYKTKARSPPQPASEPQPPKKIETPANIPLSVGKGKDATQPLEKKQEKQPTAPESNGVKDHQVKVSRMDGQNSPKIPPMMQQANSPNPAKRRKLSPAVEDPKPGTKTSKVEQQSSTMKMPRLLSPTLPSPEKESSLPQLLSPVLPPSLAKVLSTPPDTTSIGSPASGVPKRSDPVRAILAGADLDIEPSGERSGLPPGGSRIRSDSQHSARSSAPGTPNATKGALGAKILAKNGIRGGTPLHNGVRASPGPRQRHTIILKYGKKNRKRVEALLKFASRPKKDLLKNEAPEPQTNSDMHARKETSRKDPPETQPAVEVKPTPPTIDDVKLEKKRKTEDNSPGPSLKKVKVVDAEARPVTPVPPAGKTSASAQSKSTFSTPKKELKSTLMRRVESSEGVDAPTPTGDKLRVSTPQAVPKPSPRTRVSPTSSREEERQQWTSINLKFFALGRSLKHEGSALLPPPDSDTKPSQHAKAVLQVIEALLCFMINISAQSHARPNIDPGWRSIILYHIFVFRASRKFPHLHGLVVQLGAVCRQLVHKYDMDRLARDPLPDDHCNSAPTPGSDGNTKTNEDGEKYKKRYVEFRDELIQNARELQTAWLDGSRQLSPDLLKREYPKTWSKRAKDSSVRLQEKLTPSRIPQDFYLPMDANTTAFEAARFGVSFLQEWAEKEKIDWKTRIDL